MDSESWSQKYRHPLSGTTLIVAAPDFGIVMAADDMAHTEKDGIAVPRFQGVQKVFVAANNLLIGSAGVMLNPHIEYKFDDWISRFIETHRGDPGKLPSDIANALHVEIRETFKPVESSPENGGWQSYKPGEWLASYIVAGYTDNFQQPYLFEFGVQVNANRDRLVYPSPTHKRAQTFYFGEDQFWRRAAEGIEPQYSERKVIRAEVDPVVTNSLPQVPGPLQEVVAGVVSFIKVEAKFNAQKVGSGVFVSLIDRTAKAAYSASF